MSLSLIPRAFVFVEPTGSEFVFIITLEAVKPLAQHPLIFTAILKYVGQEYIDFKQPILKIFFNSQIDVSSFQRKKFNMVNIRSWWYGNSHQFNSWVERFVRPFDSAELIAGCPLRAGFILAREPARLNSKTI